MKVGYIRVSTEEQNTERQEALMRELGAEKVFMEKATGKTRKDRTQLEAMLQYVREGDVVVAESISRIARNTKDLLDIVERLEYKGVDFISKKEAIDTKTPSGKSGRIKGVEAMRELGLKPSTFYRRVREYEDGSRGHG